jgi:hypothetical protein
MLKDMKQLPLPISSQLFLSFIIIVCLSSCSDLRCIDGNNEMSNQSRKINAGFDGVTLTSDFSVFITPGQKDSISVEAESNLLPNIITEVKNGILELSTSNSICLNPRKPIIIRIYTDTISSLAITGSGSIQSDSIINEKLRISVSGSGTVKAPVNVQKLDAVIAGSGNIEIWGKSSISQLSISGSGNLESYGLDQDSCTTAISGSGNMFIYIRKSLQASITGSGSVFYKGNPEINMNISGSGKVINQQSGANSAYSSRSNFSTFPFRSMYMIY